MRVRTRSACVVLAWGILLILAAAGSIGSARPAQASTRTANSTTRTTSTTSTTSSPLRVTLTSSLTSSSPARPDVAAARPGGATYVVQPGDTLSGIAAALGTRGGWPALYAANRQVIGPDPDAIRPGTALALPGQTAPARYAVAAGDTLSGIAAALATPGGWPALYAANRHVIGPDPDTIQAGTVLTIPRPAPPAPGPRSGHHPTPAPTTSPSPVTSRAPVTSPAPTRRPASARPSAPAKARATTGLPQWLQIVLVAAGALIGIAFLAESARAIARRRRPADPTADPVTSQAGGPAAFGAAAADPRILLADYDRLVVTSSGPDGTVCVLRPPGADPEVILLAARLVLAQDRWEELAGHLGMAANGRRE
jgi:LysM repeat protein